MNRSAGILLSVTSLPSHYGIGCFDHAASDHHSSGQSRVGKKCLLRSVQPAETDSHQHLAASPSAD